jgi:hypothetical protein
MLYSFKNMIFENGGSSAKKNRYDFQFNSNLISRLPMQIIENILVRLPTKEAIRTSLLQGNENPHGPQY